MSKPEKSNIKCGSPTNDFLMDSANPTYTADPHNYDFLSIYRDFSISQHANLLNKLLTAMSNTRILDRDVFTYEVAEFLAPVLCRATKIYKHRAILFVESLFPRFASREVDKPLIFDIAMLIAGNLNIIQNEQVIVTSYDLKYPAWVPMTVQDVKDDPIKQGNRRVSFFADSSIFAGSVISKSMSPKFIRFVLREVGMPKRTHCDVRDIFGTKMSVLMMREGAQMAMSEFNTSASQEGYNKQLFKVRYGDRPCHLEKYVACQDCTMGTDNCDFAVYKTSTTPAPAEG